MSLASEIKQRLSGAAPAAPVVDNNQLANQMATQATGKAQRVPAPKASNVAASVAQGSTQAKLDQGQMAGAMQGGEIEAVSSNVAANLASAKADMASKAAMAAFSQNAAAQAADAQRAAIEDESTAKLGAMEQSSIASTANRYSNTVQELASNRGIATDDIWAQYSISNKDLDFRKDAAEMEQLAHTMRLSDRQYVDQITRVAKLRGLDNDLQFKKEAMKLQFGETYKILVDRLKFGEASAVSDSEFAEQMGALDLESILLIANAEAKAENAKNISAGVSTLGSAAGQFADSADGKATIQGAKDWWNSPDDPAGQYQKNADANAARFGGK